MSVSDIFVFEMPTVLWNPFDFTTIRRDEVAIETTTHYLLIVENELNCCTRKDQSIWNIITCKLDQRKLNSQTKMIKPTNIASLNMFEHAFKDP